LQPDDYRTGARNKKIYSVHVSKNGLVAAGTDKGDILLWELEIKSFRRSNAHKNILNLAKFLGGYKSYSKAVHFCEFSPSGYQLFSGSDDGIAKIWKIDKGGKLPPTLSEDKLLATL
jgi:WD40 repeat protein